MPETRRKPDFIRRVRNCKLAFWIDEKTSTNGNTYKSYSLALQRSYQVGDEWKQQTMYLYPDQITDIETLLLDFKMNHMVSCV